MSHGTAPMGRDVRVTDYIETADRPSFLPGLVERAQAIHKELQEMDGLIHQLRIKLVGHPREKTPNAPAPPVRDMLSGETLNDSGIIAYVETHQQTTYNTVVNACDLLRDLVNRL